MFKVGDKIRIRNMNGELIYENKVGVITSIETDRDGEIFYRGTWGGLEVYPKLDSIEYADN
jgi:hypothetical protein